MASTRVILGFKRADIEGIQEALMKIYNSVWGYDSGYNGDFPSYTKEWYATGLFRLNEYTGNYHLVSTSNEFWMDVWGKFLSVIYGAGIKPVSLYSTNDTIDNAVTTKKSLVRGREFAVVTSPNEKVYYTLTYHQMLRILSIYQRRGIPAFGLSYAEAKEGHVGPSRCNKLGRVIASEFCFDWFEMVAFARNRTTLERLADKS
jgi:hypothetical protein